MTEDGKRRFSLSDINRKLGAERSDKKAQGRSSPERRRVEDGSRSGSNRDSPPRSSELQGPFPEQPRFGPTPPPTGNAPQGDSSGFVEEKESGPSTAVAVDEKPAAPKPSAFRESGLTPPADEEEEEFDVLRYISILLRRKTIIILATLIAGGYSFYTYLNAQRYYTAHARLLFSPGHQEIVAEGSIPWEPWGSREKRFLTHLELLQSNRELLLRVAERFGEEITSGVIRKNLRVVRGETQGERNNIIELYFDYRDAEAAGNIVNAVCTEYISYIQEVNAQDISRMVLKFSTQIEKVKSELAEKENALREFKERNRLVQLSSETNLVLSKLSDMELALQKAQLDLLENRERFEAIRSEIREQDINVVNSITYEDPYKNRLFDLQFELNTLLAEYSPDHFKVRKVRQKIEKLKKAMQSDITTRTSRSQTFVKNPIRQSLLESLVNLTIQKASLESKRAAQEQIIEKLDRELGDLPSLELEYANLQRGTQSLEKTLGMLESQYERAKIKRDSQESDLKVLELADKPRAAISSIKLKRVFLGFFVGLVLGIGLAFLFEYLDQTIKEPRDLERILELPLLGIIPLIEGEKAVIDPNPEKSKSKLEPFRALRANLKHLITQHDIRSLLLCSPVKGEGKTTLATNMAISFAMDGRRVILVDADLRRPQIHTMFEMPKEHGLADYLEGGKGLDELLKPTPHKNLRVLSSGARPDHPTELMGTVRFDTLLRELKERCDLVVFDSPALLPVSDAVTVAPKMDACLVIARNLWTPARAAKQARNQLLQVGCTLLGAVHNGVSQARGYYPYYYGYYRYYAYKYTYDYDEESAGRKGKSLREFGLKAEEKLRGTLQGATLSVPRLVTLAGRTLKSLGRKPLFWLLTAAAVIGTLGFAWLDRTGGSGRADRIEYLGATEGPDDEFVAGAGQSGKPSYPAEDEDDVFDLESATGPESGTPSGAQEGTSAMPPLDSVLAAWQSYVLEGDAQRYLRFYHPTEFIFPGGGTADRQKTASAALFKTLLAADTGYVETSRQSVIDDTFRRSLSSIVSVTAQDTQRVGVRHVWKAEAGEWSIVRERHEEIN